MLWSEKFTSEKQPTLADINNYIKSKLWCDLCSFLEADYSFSPKIEYSKCSMAKGWNVKYKKGSKSICTLYPNDGYFTCLVTLNDKMHADFAVLMCCDYIQSLYNTAKPVNGSKWLMIDVTTSEILNDVKNLITLKTK